MTTNKTGRMGNCDWLQQLHKTWLTCKRGNATAHVHSSSADTSRDQNTANTPQQQTACSMLTKINYHIKIHRQLKEQL